jgi:hypothetical protein
LEGLLNFVAIGNSSVTEQEINEFIELVMTMTQTG